jgi:hypothetical protein
MRLYFGQPAPVDFQTLVFQFPQADFQNLTRSTIPLLCYWRNTEEVLSHLLKVVFGKKGAPSGDLCFEYPVKSAGRNMPSFTDVMYVTEDLALGIEGKSTEPMYETVEQWLQAGQKPENRRRVLQHWLSLIRRRTGMVMEEEILGCVYQMVHRTASVCSLSRKECAVAYQVFHVEERTIEYQEYLARLSQAITAGGKVGIWLHEIEAKTTDFFHQTQQTLNQAKSISDKAGIVRSAIMSGRLFSFTESGLQRIRNSS